MDDPTVPADDFLDLWHGLCRGDNRAAASLHARYATRLFGLASRRLDGWTAADRGPDDLVQSAFRSFFRRCRAGEFEPEGWDGLWSLLALITRRKCGHRREYLAAARRGGLPARLATRATAYGPADPRPGPEDAAILGETLDSWLGALGQGEREIVALGLQGYDTAAIAVRLGRSERTVRRVRRYAEDRLVDLARGDGVPA